MPPKYKDKPAKMAALRYANGARVCRGDTVLDKAGRKLRVIGMDDISNRLLVIADGHRERIDPQEVEKVTGDDD